MKLTSIFCPGILALVTYPAAAQVLYQQNFDSLTLGSTAATPGTYVAGDNIGTSGWQIQGGCGGGTVGLTTGINNNGTGGSKALFGTWDNSTASAYTWNQYTYYGVGGAGAGVSLSQIQISLDLYISGSDSATPITVSATQNSGNNALNLTPTLANDQFTHLQFTLNQATASGGAFDPTAAFWFRVSHGNAGFGFDTPNTVQIDNVVISVIPEPPTYALLAVGALGLIWLRRRS